MADREFLDPSKDAASKDETFEGDMDPLWNGFDAVLAGLQSGTRVQELLSQVLDLGAASNIADALLIVEPGQTSGPARILASHGLSKAEIRKPALALSRASADWVARGGRALTCADLDSDARFEEMDPEGFVWAVGLPMVAYQHSHGVLVFLGREARDLKQDEVLRQRLVSMAAIILLQFRTHEKLRLIENKLENEEARRLEAETSRDHMELASSISRELDNTLGPILEDLRTRDREDLLQAAARAERLAEQLREITRDTRRDLKLVDLNELVEECLYAATDVARERGVQVQQRLGVSVPRLLLDSALVRRVISNMVVRLIESSKPRARLVAQTVRRGGQVELFMGTETKWKPGQILDTLWSSLGETDEAKGFSLETARHFLTEMRASIEAEATDQWPLAFRIRFPIAHNRDRRLNPGAKGSNEEAA
ncbi:MAG: hypothetical protein HKN21_09115 [Candidatus Eisenbacteria bacterium]|uniref:Histidine kinase domain-containing protein n=1 Tax=Eiseniibacteriota bacterium TaxID=2212470 RepID=A0A7Y2H2P8_UNCEI|nr:hypothetical protein [Candidatus Eisenbacteria bacterium]